LIPILLTGQYVAYAYQVTRLLALPQLNAL